MIPRPKVCDQSFPLLRRARDGSRGASFRETRALPSYPASPGTHPRDGFSTVAGRSPLGLVTEGLVACTSLLLLAVAGSQGCSPLTICGLRFCHHRGARPSRGASPGRTCIAASVSCVCRTPFRQGDPRQGVCMRGRGIGLLFSGGHHTPYPVVCQPGRWRSQGRRHPPAFRNAPRVLPGTPR